jgi:phenylacetate-CoA ligase
MQVKRRYRSAVEGVIFPAFIGPAGAELLAALAQLEQSQWWPVEQLRATQQEQLQALLNHAMRTVPYYQQCLSEAGYLPGGAWDENLWSALPILTRQQVQTLGSRLHSQALPSGHGNTFLMQSSGSTGRPVQVLGSDITRFYWDVATLRDNDWQQHDFMQKFAAVRPDRGVKEQDRIFIQGRGMPVDWIYHSVPAMVINSRVDVRQQLIWLQEFQPVYLLSLPSNLRELLRLCEHDGIELPGLQQVRSYGETVTQSLRDYVRKVWGVGLSDSYSSQEVGYMALQCPEHEHYHVQAETMYLEVLDENDKPCAPGEIGRVVVTPLHNFAMPLIRYEVGDYAEAGEPCSCGRGLPVLKRIVGRTRNMVRTPEGRCYWPSFPLEDWLDVADIHQFQLRQIALDHIEVLLVMAGELSAEQTRLLEQKLRHSLNYSFNLDFRYVDSIQAQANGKYEDFISLL